MSSQNGENAGSDGEEGGSSGSNPGGSAAETTVDDVVARVDALSTQLTGVREELHSEREERRDLERQLEERDERISNLEAEIARLDARTDLLRLVENADEMDAKQRSTALVQHLHSKAKARERRDERPAAAVNRDEAEEALRFPAVERTTIYRDMERAERLVGDKAVLEYADGELVLDLEAGSLPGRFASDGEVSNL